MNVPFLSRTKRYFAMTGDVSGAVLAELVPGARREPILRILASSRKTTITYQADLQKLLAPVPGPLKGNVAVALPLSLFTTRNITLPIMPREAIGQALPYHLAKVSDQPLQDLIYDWQITHFEKNNLKLTVYLFSASTFKMMRQELAVKQLELAYLECDVFAACALLERQDRLSAEDASLCILLWSDSISMAIYEKGKLTVVRSLPLGQPETPYSAEELAVELEMPAAAVAETEPAADEEKPAGELPPEPPPKPDASYIDYDETVSILASFDIVHGGYVKDAAAQNEAAALPKSFELVSAPPPEPKPEPEPASGPLSSWVDYLNQINLEAVRTRDYYKSVVKGAPVRQIFVGGADEFLDDLRALVHGATDIKIEPLSLTDYRGGDCPPSFGAICAGTGARW